MTEIAQMGWENLAKMLGMSLSSAKRRRVELTNAGVIFYRHVGRPPRKRVHFFSSRVIKWTGLKAAKGEMI